LLVREAEAMNKSLKLMVYAEASSPTEMQYISNSGWGEHNMLPCLGTPGPSFKRAKPLNPQASCFKSLSPRKKVLVKDKGNHNKNQSPAKVKSSFFAAEMKRKFAELCREDKKLRSKSLVNVSLNVVREKDNSVTVKVALPVMLTKYSPSSHKPADDLSMNLKSVSDQRFLFARPKRDHVNKRGPKSSDDALSPQNRMNVQQAYDLKNLQSASTTQAESFLGDCRVAVE